MKIIVTALFALVALALADCSKPAPTPPSPPPSGGNNTFVPPADPAPAK